MPRILVFTLLICLGSSTLSAQNVSSFTLPEVNTGDMFSLDAITGQEGVVLIYMSNKCPFSTAYLDRLRQMNADFPSILFILINAYTTSSESMVNMKTTWMDWDVNMPYLADKEQVTAEQFKITKSPTAVVLKPVGNNYSVYYKGQIDNNPQVANDVKEAYLLENLKALLANKPPIYPNNQAVGCTVR